MRISDWSSDVCSSDLHDLSAWEDVLGFASGFGFIGNFTYQKAGGSSRESRCADGPRTVFTPLGYPGSQDLLSLTNLSTYAYTTTLFYDKYGLNERLRYKWRAGYVSNVPCFFGLPLI